MTCLHVMVANFPSEMEREKQRRMTKRKATVFNNPISKASYHHFCHILLVTRNHPCTIEEGTPKECEYPETGIGRGHLGGQLPQNLFWNLFIIIDV